MRRFPRNPVISTRHGEVAQADLIDVSRYAKSNRNPKFILTLIGVFSKYAYAIPLKTKSAAQIHDALESIFDGGGGYRPGRLQTDEGKEFTNRKVQHLLKDYLIKFYLATNERIKCAVVERFQRTLMTKLHKYFTSKGTVKFIDILPDLVNSYNNTYHRSIRMTPHEASQPTNNAYIFRNLYGFSNLRAMIRSRQLQPRRLTSSGDHVRIPQQKNVFGKGYRQNFTDAIYTVVNRNDLQPGKRPVYKIKTYDGDKVRGTFYPEELQTVPGNDVYRVQVLRYRYRGKRRQALVKYYNFPDQAPEWIPTSQLQSLSG